MIPAVNHLELPSKPSPLAAPLNAAKVKNETNAVMNALKTIKSAA
jgi:hypothetical protein